MTRRKMKKQPEWVRNKRLQKLAEEGRLQKVLGNEIPSVSPLTIQAPDAAISTRLHREAVASWTLARQRLVLQLHRRGLNPEQIAERVQSIGKTQQRIHQQQILSLVERGIPFPREAPAHRCKKCSKVIVTDFCITCELREIRNEQQRTLEAV